MRKDVLQCIFRSHVPPGSLDEQWDIPGLVLTLSNEFGVELPVQAWIDEDDEIADEGIYDRIADNFEQAYQQKAEKKVKLSVIWNWKRPFT